MRTRFLSQAAWLTMLMGTAFSVAKAADVPKADLRSGVAEAQTLAQSAAQSAGQATTQPAAPLPPQQAIVTAGPIYAYGPVIQTAKPRQRARTPNRGNSNDYGRSNGMRTAAPYWNERAQGFAQPWQYGPPRYNSYARWNNNPYRYGYPGPSQNWRQYPSNGSQNQNSMAWYDRNGRPIDTPDRSRPSNWRY